MNIFITGATSFLGAFVLNQLAKLEDYRIFSFSKSKNNDHLPPAISSNINWIKGDLLDESILYDIMPDMQLVIHLEELKSRKKSRQQLMWDLNVTGTENIINAALDANVKKLVYLSSVEALGKSLPSEALTEENVWVHSRWNTQYGLTKFQGELEVWRGMEEGLNATVLLPSNIIGEKKLFQLIQNGLKYYPEGATGWVDVRDLAQTIVFSLLNETPKRRYIINAENISYREVFEMIGNSLNKSTIWKKVPSPLVNLAAGSTLLSSFFPHFDPETALQTSCLFHYHNQRSLLDLIPSYTPVSYSIQEAAAAFIQSKKSKSSIYFF